jgi:predicted RNA-binding Zn-ribbon protein involved in translation (DUF1610 family)
MEEFNCPHCGAKISGTSLILLGLDNEKLIDAASPCPSCGKMIYKKDYDKAIEKNKGNS